ncbi:hypothetical protein T03_9310 [Trichinella britovi]|nr:hypothetical protein T09_4807 [Trichinella sp. T9]KRX78277.1 hypothetical protein T06_5211 [Trichinella sp. T6]KRY32911.1 hypothetical protein T01_11825 [Trichinella spiralis]KRY57086.1 hypothetical protein T03_9310 [Trichinella britovi]KRZ87094.1 hypothetical protein T08_10342 [Trichinella sp. T8]
MLNWVSNVSLPNIGCIIGFVDISMGILGNAIPTYCQDHSGRKDRFVFLHFKNICMNTFFEQSDNTVAEDCWQRLISVNNGYTAIVH